MTVGPMNREYVEWMYELVSDRRLSKTRPYSKLFDYLHSVEFVYTIPLDGNRAEDGIQLRYRFGEDRGYPDPMIAAYLDDQPCSVLEMMIALALRYEENIMYDTDMGNRTGQWFWGMIENLGLSDMNNGYFDEDYVEMVVYRLLNHKYKRNGEGGLFTVSKQNVDMRNVEIWYQAAFYFNEVLGLV